MAEDVKTEIGRAQPVSSEQAIAQRWLRAKGIQRPGEQQPTQAQGSQVETPAQLISEAYDLIVERDELNLDLARRQIVIQDPNRPSFASLSEEWASVLTGHKHVNVMPLRKKEEMIRQGRIQVLMGEAKKEPFAEVVAQSQARIADAEARLDQIFATPGMYETFTQDLSRQVRARHQAHEVRSIDRFTEHAQIVVVQMIREAQVQGRVLTSMERQSIEDSQHLSALAQERKQELLKDPDVFDRVRIQEIQEYKQQLADDRFAETPSRKAYLHKIERYWAEGKKVLLTGETGTGKTEIIKHASNKLFGVNPESVTGHQDLSIYELLGKTGFQVQVGDVFRPAPLIRAMAGRDGKGQPFLFDEIDRAPNQSVMGIKTILNARPGEKGVKVQTDTAGSFDVGQDYAVSATANIKSEKYTTATELDPAIVRVFDAPMDIDYMPAHEVYDLALSSLMDKRGGILLSESDARAVLKNLCDAASWIQDAYQSRRITTNPADGSFLEARGQAATGKPATLKKALLDPGRTLDMLQGWSAAQVRGVSFEEYLNGRIVEFVNNRAYPQEDRYYLAEIFALKGFLKGHKTSELMVSGLTQDTLDRWSGATNRRTAQKKGGHEYLSAAKVARLDPYRRFKRPVSAEAEDLLAEEQAGEAEAMVGDNTLAERAREILGKDFLGVEAVRNLEAKLAAVGKNVEFDLDKLPPIPYTEEDLRVAKDMGEMLVVRPDAMLAGGRKVPLSLIEFRELFRRDPLGIKQNLFYSFESGSSDWYKTEAFATGQGEIKLGWALVKKEVLDGSQSKTWNDQETLLKQYEDGLKRKGAINAQIRRRTGMESTWDTLLYYFNTGESLLENVYDWAQSRSSLGSLVYVGGFVSAGLGVGGGDPGRSFSNLGVVPSR